MCQGTGRVLREDAIQDERVKMDVEIEAPTEPLPDVANGNAVTPD